MTDKLLSTLDTNDSGSCLDDWVLLALKDPWTHPASVVSDAVKAAIRYTNDKITHAVPIQSMVRL